MLWAWAKLTVLSPKGSGCGISDYFRTERLIFKIKFAILLVFPLSLVHGQQEELDSIRTFLDAHPERDTTRVHALIDYASLTYHDEALNGLPLIKEAIQISREVGFAKGVGLRNILSIGLSLTFGLLEWYRASF